MDHIVISNVPGYDGRYEFDIAGSEFTTREWGWIKRLSGYMPLNIDQGFEGGDPELFAVFAVIALRRAGKVDVSQVPQAFERLSDAPFGASVTIEAGEREDDDDAGPPPESLRRNGGFSGTDSTTSSEASTEEILPASGTPASASSPSAPLRSGS